MNFTNIVPITKARTSLGNLAKKAKGDNYVILTKAGKPEAALVDLEYLQGLEEEIKKIYGRTFINPELLPLTRNFTQKEINTWKKADALD